MDENEQRPDDGPPEESAGGAEPSPEAKPAEVDAGETEPAPQPTAEAAEERRGESPRYVQTVVVSAALLLLALAFFVAGYWIRDLQDEDGGGGETPASASDDPAWGPDDARVTIEEFGDFQCPYCGQFALETLPKIREAYGDRVRYVFRDFPIVSIHEFAQKAAEAAQCAQEQALFWEYHDLLFADQEALAAPDLKRNAEQVGADMGEFNACLDSDKNAWEVLLDVRDGTQAGVTGTPAFLINGILLPGVAPFERFQAIIDQALAGVED